MPTDTEMLDALEKLVQECPLVLWGAAGTPHDFREAKQQANGLSLLGGRRTLREALGNIVTNANPAAPADKRTL